MSTGHQSPQSNLSPLAYKTVNTTTWGAGGNTCTIADTYINSNSVFHVWVTGLVAAAGNWALTITDNQVIITSSDAESSTLPISYIVL